MPITAGRWPPRCWGDATKVRFSPLTAQARFTALQTGEIDVLYRNSTQTFLRDASLGLNQGPVNFYDGQGFAVRRDAGVDKVQQLGWRHHLRGAGDDA